MWASGVDADYLGVTTDETAGSLSSSAKFAVDAQWLNAVVAALHVIHAAGVTPDDDLLAGVLADARRAVGLVAADEGIRGTALATVAIEFLVALDGCGGGLGADETRASVCVAAEIVSLAARQAFARSMIPRQRS